MESWSVLFQINESFIVFVPELDKISFFNLQTGTLMKV